MIITFVLIVATLSNKREGFNEFNFDEKVYIPYVSQDIVCLILLGAGVKIDKYGILYNKCTRDKKNNVLPDDSNICPTILRGAHVPISSGKPYKPTKPVPESEFCD